MKLSYHTCEYANYYIEWHIKQETLYYLYRTLPQLWIVFPEVKKRFAFIQILCLPYCKYVWIYIWPMGYDWYKTFWLLSNFKIFVNAYIDLWNDTQWKMYNDQKGHLLRKGSTLMACLSARFPSTSFFPAHWTLRWGNSTMDEVRVSRERRQNTPFLQSLPTRVCGWGLYGSSFVTHDTTISDGPVYSWTWSQFLKVYYLHSMYY